MVDKARFEWSVGWERLISEKKKNGFYLTALDGEDTGEITDTEYLKEIPKKKIIIKRMIDKNDNAGFYLRSVEQKTNGFLKSIFPTTQTGGIFDKYWLDEHPLEPGDVIKITLIPMNKIKLRIKVECRWEDQPVDV